MVRRGLALASFTPVDRADKNVLSDDVANSVLLWILSRSTIPSDNRSSVPLVKGEDGGTCSV